jgi:hypothetical protein
MLSRRGRRRERREAVMKRRRMGKRRRRRTVKGRDQQGNQQVMLAQADQEQRLSHEANQGRQQAQWKKGNLGQHRLARMMGQLVKAAVKPGWRLLMMMMMMTPAVTSYWTRKMKRHQGHRVKTKSKMESSKWKGKRRHGSGGESGEEQQLRPQHQGG